MALPIEDYAVIGDTQSAALVGRDGSIDWLCLPRFDSSAIFSALLGRPEHGRWLLGPAGEVHAVRRRYRGDTLLLETEFDTEDGTVRLVDFMPPRGEAADVVRIVEGVRGRVSMRMELTLRFDYGRVLPWVRRIGHDVVAAAGPDAVWLRTPIEVHSRASRGSSTGEDGNGGRSDHGNSADALTNALAKESVLVAEFSVGEGFSAPFVLTWRPSHQPAPHPVDPYLALATTDAFWRNWIAPCTYVGEWRDAVVRSLLTLKGLQYAPTGGIVAATTTSLPERLGGVRNWDYRFCWLRDATITLQAFMHSGLFSEAEAWRQWLLRAIAGDPGSMQIMYGVGGERRLTEYDADWLPGYESSVPVRIGNAASEQFQLDVYGEVMDALHQARKDGLARDEDAWALQTAMMGYLERHWTRPDEGIWEVRGESQQFTHSKLMAWVAADRAVKAVQDFGLPGPERRWRALRDDIRSDILTHGYDHDRGTFTQYYGSAELDAAMLMAPLVGFLPASDEHIRGTVAAIEKELLVDGFVHRYTQPPAHVDPASSRTADRQAERSGGVDGLPPGEGAFLACSFWLADNYALMGRRDEAHQLFERLLALRNDVGLLAEEYDPRAQRLTGNFPQAFSHVPLIQTARNLSTIETRTDIALRSRNRPTQAHHGAAPPAPRD